MEWVVLERLPTNSASGREVELFPLCLEKCCSRKTRGSGRVQSSGSLALLPRTRCRVGCASLAAGGVRPFFRCGRGRLTVFITLASGVPAAIVSSLLLAVPREVYRNWWELRRGKIFCFHSKLLLVVPASSALFSGCFESRGERQ